MPRDGYTAMFERMLDHPLIEVRTGVDYDEVGATARAPLLVWTGPIDAYFDYRLGKLPYRSCASASRRSARHRRRAACAAGRPGQLSRRATRLHARHRVPPPDRPGRATQRRSPTSTRRPRATPTTRSRARRTASCTSATGRSPRPSADVVFVGRLARYQYFNMDQVVAQALLAARRAFGSRRRAPRARLAPQPARRGCRNG